MSTLRIEGHNPPPPPSPHNRDRHGANPSTPEPNSPARTILTATFRKGPQPDRRRSKTEGPPRTRRREPATADPFLPPTAAPPGAAAPEQPFPKRRHAVRHAPPNNKRTRRSTRVGLEYRARVVAWTEKPQAEQPRQQAASGASGRMILGRFDGSRAAGHEYHPGTKISAR